MTSARNSAQDLGIQGIPNGKAGCMMEAGTGQLTVSPEKGVVSTLLVRPEKARAMVALGHGAGAGMRHAHMEQIAEALAAAGIATFRYQFPFMERGGGRDSLETSVATVRAAVEKARTLAEGLPLFAGGHSFGGRMTTTAASMEPLDDVRGLILFSYPLHPSGKPGVARAEHLRAVAVPMLFLSGSRDKLAERELFEPVCAGLSQAKLHWIDTADHGFGILKRSRAAGPGPHEEAASVVRDWVAGQIAPR